MRLDKIKIKDFKSIKNLTIKLDSLTCLVGKNESGKSSILEAIRHLNWKTQKLSTDTINKSSSKYLSDGFPEITGYFLMTNEDNSLLEEIVDFKFDTNNKSIPNNFDFKYLRLSIKGNTDADITIDAQHSNNKVYDFKSHYENESYNHQKILLEIYDKLIPNIDLFYGEEFNLNPVTYEQLLEKNNDSLSFRRLFEIADMSDLKTLNDKNTQRLQSKLYKVGKKITEILQETYKQDSSLEVTLSILKDKFTLSFIDDSENNYGLNERSAGFKYFFSFLINKTYQHLKSNKKTIFLLDEPGLSLHPKGARDLMKLFESISKKDQIVYTTHNPFLAFKKNPDSLQLVIREEKLGTKVHSKTYLNKYELVRRELGLLLNDSFLINDINLVVEGNSDKWLLQYVINEDSDLEKLIWVHIFSTDTATEIIPSIRYLDSLNLKGFALLDSDKEARDQIKLPKFKKYIIDKTNWDYCTVNKIYNDDIDRTIEDLLPPEKYLNAYNEYYIQEKDTIDWDSPFSPSRKRIFEENGILKLINEHHKKFHKGGINKIAVFRKFTEIYPYEVNKEDYKNLKNILIFILNELLQKQFLD